MSNDISNKCVLSSRLKDSTDEAVLMLTGSVFHAQGPATVYLIPLKKMVTVARKY